MIYCNMTDCAYRKKLDEPHKRDSMIPVTYDGVCGLDNIILTREDFLSAGRNRNLVATCDYYTEIGEDGWEHTYELNVPSDRMCGLTECANQVDGLCEKSNRAKDGDIYVTPTKVWEGNEEQVVPACTSKAVTLMSLGRKDWSQYPKR